jgi:hypothetical protein
VAERQLPKLNVAGSIPVSRSIPHNLVLLQVRTDLSMAVRKIEEPLVRSHRRVEVDAR